jgi:RNA polymerase sigma-70 factor (ECF subfamily)
MSSPRHRLTAEEVFRAHAPRVYRLALRLLGGTADAEDVTQDVLLQVVRKLGTFRGEAELTTWLHRVTVNAALVHRRRRAPRLAREVHVPSEGLADRGRPDAGVPSRDPLPEKQLLDGELERQIERAIARLPEKYRDAFVLAEVEKLPSAQIGELLGLSAAALKSRLHRARLLLRDALGPYLQEMAGD